MQLEERRPMNTARAFHQMTSFGECLMVTGGQKKEEYGATAACEVYDIVTGKWEAIEPMNSCRIGHSAIEVKPGVIYVFSGMGIIVSSIEYFT